MARNHRGIAIVLLALFVASIGPIGLNTARSSGRVRTFERAASAPRPEKDSAKRRHRRHHPRTVPPSPSPGAPNGYSVKAIYALPSDGADRGYGSNGTIQRSVDAVRRWFRGQTLGPDLRWDPTVPTVRLA